MRIKKNALKCLLCDDVIESVDVHDFKYCKCGNAMIDGGLDYVRYGWEQSQKTIELLTEYEDENDN